MIKARVVRRRHASRDILDRIAKSLDGPKHVKAGFIDGDAPREVIERATYAEFGRTGQPERPFLRAAMADNKGRYAGMMRDAAAKLLHGHTTLERALDGIGAQVATDIRQAMTEAEPPLAESTVRRKGDSTVLVETGEMAASVTHKVEG